MINVKFDLYFKKKLGTLFKSNEVDLDGVEANVNLDLNQVASMKINYLVNGNVLTDDVIIKDVDKKLILIPFKSEVRIAGAVIEFEIQANMLNGDVKVSQTYVYEVMSGIGEGVQVGTGGSTDGHYHNNLSTLHKITEAKIKAWDAKSDFSGSYNDLTNKPTIPTVDVTKSYVDGEVSKKADRAHSHSEYATPSYVQEKIAEASLSGGDVDLSAYATKTELNTKADKTHTHNELHSHNNKTVLDGITSSKVNEWNNKSTFNGDYNSLTNKPVIPSTEGLASESYVQAKIAEASLSDGRIVTEDTSKLSKTIYKMLMGESVTINCIGDSVTQADYPSYLQSRLQLIYDNNNITVKNNGTSGQTSEQVYSLLGSKIKDEDDLIVLMYGINDASGLVQNPFATAEKHKQQMDDIVNYCTNLNKEVLIVSSTPTFGHSLWINSGSYSSLVDRRIKCMKLADEEVANKYNVGFLDMSNAYLELFDLGFEKQSEVYTDECHFTNDGYKYVSEIILKNKLDIVSYINADNRDKMVQIAKSPYIITDVTRFQTGAGALNKYITLAKDSSLGTKVIFDFYNSMQECKFSLFGKKDANGGTIHAKLDGTIVVLDFNSDHTINENEFVLSENLKHGYHRLEFYTSDLVSGNVYLSHFKFVNRIKNTSEEGEVTEVKCVSISLNEASKTLKVGDTASLSVVFNPSNTTNKTVTWSTNNKEVATVLNGVVTCVGVGECTITAMSANGKVATCNIIVNDNEEEDAPPLVDNELTPFNGKKITFTGNYGVFNHVAFTCVIDASNLVKGDNVKMVYEFDNCVNTGRAEYTFSDLSSFFASDITVSNGQFSGACTPPEGQATIGINIIGTAGSGEITRTLLTNGSQGEYMRFTSGVVFNAKPFSFRIKNLAVYVNDVQVKVLNVGGFFAEETFNME